MAVSWMQYTQMWAAHYTRNLGASIRGYCTRILKNAPIQTFITASINNVAWSRLQMGVKRCEDQCAGAGRNADSVYPVSCGL